MATSTASTQDLTRDRTRLLAFLERERLVVGVVAIFATLALVTLPHYLNQDGWLALVSGRLIAHDGLPHHDTLTVWSSGVRWVDQQWLSQLLMYALQAAGGLRLLAFAHVALLVSGLVVAVTVARRRAGPVSVALVAALAFFSLAIVFLQVRTQAFAVPLFAVVLALLLSDARTPSRRVWLALPLLVVWANMHGSVVLGAGLVGLRGLTIAAPALRHQARGELLRGVGLMVGAVVAVFATPYAAEMPAYYRSTLLNSRFAEYVREWGPTTPSLMTAAFYALLLLAAWALWRRWARLTAFERLTLVATGVSGTLALRNMGWFALAALMILPPALDGAKLASHADGSRAARLTMALGPIAALAIAATVTLAQPQRLEQRYPSEMAAVVSHATAPHSKVLATLRFGDWLLWHRPDLAGRVAFDTRVELMTPDQLADLSRLANHLPGWAAVIDGYDVIVLNRGGERAPSYRAVLALGGFRIAYLDRDAAVLVRAT